MYCSLAWSCGALIRPTDISLAIRGNKMEQEQSKQIKLGKRAREALEPATGTIAIQKVSKAAKLDTSTELLEGHSKVVSQQSESKPRKNFKAKSLEEIDNMSEEELREACLSSVSRAKVRKRTNTGQEYNEAKRAVIRENFIRCAKKQGMTETNTAVVKTCESTKPATSTRSSGRAPTVVSGPARTVVSRVAPTVVSRPTSTTVVSGLNPTDERPVTIAVADVSYPQTLMEPAKLKATQRCILEAYEKIPEQGPQVRFSKCAQDAGYLLIQCVDGQSAQWLKETVPTLEPWEGGCLLVLDGDDIPKSRVCTTFVPDELGEAISLKRILNRLRVGNRGLRTPFWAVLDSTPGTSGALWTFSIDQASYQELVRLDMRPFFGYGKLHFRIGGMS